MWSLARSLPLWGRSPSRGAHGAADCGAALALLTKFQSCRRARGGVALARRFRGGGSLSARARAWWVCGACATSISTSRNKQETDGSRHSTAPPGAQNSLCGLKFRKVRQILLRLRQKISPVEAKERKLWMFEEGQLIFSLESRQHRPDQSPESA